MLAAREATLHKTQIAYDVGVDLLVQPGKDLRLHQIEFLNPHRARHFNHSRVKLERGYLGAARDRLADHLRPQPGEPYDSELPFGVEAIQKRLQGLADLHWRFRNLRWHRVLTIARIFLPMNDAAKRSRRRTRGRRWRSDFP